MVVVAAACCGMGADAAKTGGRAAPAGSLPEAVRTAPSGKVMDVAPVDRDRRDAVAAAAERIDAHLGKRWKELGLKPASRLSDEQFARRVYLDLGGRIPTYDEVMGFLTSRSRTKRAELVEQLLESPDYVSNFYNFWADILRLRERPHRVLPFEPYLYYVKDTIRTNKPYDDWVHEMLTADGLIWENPAVGYQLRDMGMPLPYVDNTVRVFLGTQIGCAQCHDHPFDHWTQKQFYELAAFTNGTRMRLGKSPARDKRSPREPDAGDVRRLVQAVRSESDRPVYVQFIGANAAKVGFADSPLGLPPDYQYDDAKPLDAVSPRLLWGEVPAAARSADGRARLAAWMVSHDNRQFARTIANRMWRRMMGVGLVEPIDDFRDENPPSDPELLDLLTDLMVELDFDLREFVRVIAATSVYQRRAVVYDPAVGEPFRFTAPALRRMTAEQVWDSILTLVARNPWSIQRPDPARIKAAVAIDLRQADAKAVMAKCDAYLAELGPGGYHRSLAQVCGSNGQLLVRASEIPTPLPLGHFLRQFGQSDRESIEGGRTVATVPQILAMFNGPITHAMLQPGSAILDEVTSHRPEQAIDVVFLSILTRRPASDERRYALEEIMSAAEPAIGGGNVVWSLLNTREFLFIQ
jgi:hypothetical protein